MNAFQRLGRFTQYVSSNTDPDHLRLLLSSCARQNNLRLSSSLHAAIIKSPPSFSTNQVTAHLIYNSLLNVYCKSGSLRDAVNLFDQMPLRDTVSWNSLISGFFNLGRLRLGFRYFKKLLGSSWERFDHATLTSVLSACGEIESVEMMNVLHALAVLSGYEKETTVGNALITSYFRCRAFGSGRRVFDEMLVRNVVTWTATVSGLAKNELYAESLDLFVKMCTCGTVSPNALTYLGALSACSGLRALNEGAQIHGALLKSGLESDLRVESSLMDVYSKCGCLGDAWRIFHFAEVIDEVSLTVMLVGLAQNGFEEDAVRMFLKTIRAGLNIDPDMISAILGIFGLGTSHGVQIHSLVIKKGFGSNIFVCNGLINMYSRCGELQDSVKAFDCTPEKNQVSWNSVIAAFARHGEGSRALAFYEKMTSSGVKPSDVTFLSLLHACSHVGLLHKGMEFLQSMEITHGLRPRMEHYSCMVDMLGRAGLLREAREFISGLPVKPNALVWQALLGACSIYNDVDVGEYAADRLARAEPDSPVPFVSMANIYSSKGQWKERASAMKEMKEKGVAKEMGTSWIEIDRKIHNFVVADRMHPSVDDVYAVVLDLFGHMRDEGCVMDSILPFDCQ
ncbi:pentatricopeptide repeat-containing protein [Striga asiatica]|uniref:Pentatricopeptide repeat-containing protein n=1 Tax=Striga asiatica TaxID=4170 RepID=A0A5A7RCD0_STRAF|nr:pentatricopeptide repeat-containing protein [Striga asiatica]